jgi:hypothetical protein
MSAGLLVNQNRTSIAIPKLSASGIPIGAGRKANSLPSEITNRQLWDSSFQYRELWQRTLKVRDLYSGPAKAIYRRPRGMRVDTYC